MQTVSTYCLRGSSSPRRASDSPKSVRHFHGWSNTRDLNPSNQLGRLRCYQLHQCCIRPATWNFTRAHPPPMSKRLVRQPHRDGRYRRWNTMISQQTASVSRNICGIFATEVAEKEDIRSRHEQLERKAFAPRSHCKPHYRYIFPINRKEQLFFSLK